jgi:hypothetical protein
MNRPLSQKDVLNTSVSLGNKLVFCKVTINIQRAFVYTTEGTNLVSFLACSIMFIILYVALYFSSLFSCS